METLLTTALTTLHQELGARMVPFAGYTMPVQYQSGVLKEHLHTRAAAGLFDVSHMGQFLLRGRDAAAALEQLVPVDIVGLKPGQQRYALFTSEGGGILDDLMVSNVDGALYVVVNAACKAQDRQWMLQSIGNSCEIMELREHALLALQGPLAASIMRRLGFDADMDQWLFMQARTLTFAGVPCIVTRSGYTGEDGFEISIPNQLALTLAEKILAQPEVMPIGLGARDSLRLEAGLCLYGHDIDTGTTPVEASLSWAISKARRDLGARPGGFPGSETILGQLREGTTRRRVGLVGVGRPLIRGGCPITGTDGKAVGTVTSGGFSPSSGRAIAMAYVPTELAVEGTLVNAPVRGNDAAMHVTKTPFVPQKYYRGPVPR